MYAVVGCSACSGLWLVADPDEQATATCQRCGRQHEVTSLRRLYEAETREAARDARAAMLADRQGAGDAFADVPSGADLDRAVETAGVDDDEYLDRRGVDPEAAREAGERDDGGSTDRATVVREAVRDLDRPTAAAVVEHASERGVPADAARDLLDRLERAGEVTVDGGVYRLL